jgi:hypothetical protein
MVQVRYVIGISLVIESNLKAKSMCMLIESVQLFRSLNPLVMVKIRIISRCKSLLQNKYSELDFLMK